MGPLPIGFMGSRPRLLRGMRHKTIIVTVTPLPLPVDLSSSMKHVKFSSISYSSCLVPLSLFPSMSSSSIYLSLLLLPFPPLSLSIFALPLASFFPYSTCLLPLSPSPFFPFLYLLPQHFSSSSSFHPSSSPYISWRFRK